MITIQSGKMHIPENERFVGFAGDDLSSTKIFNIPGMTGGAYTLYLKFDDGRVSSVPLTAEASASGVTLTWAVSKRHLLKSGIVMAQLKIADTDGSVIHTGWDYFIVASAVELDDGGEEIDMLSRSEFEERMAEGVALARSIAPYIGDDGYWYVYSDDQGDYVRSVRVNGIELDSSVSASSANAVENRAVKAYVDAADSSKVDKTTTVAGLPLSGNITASDLTESLIGRINPHMVVPGVTSGYPGQYGKTSYDVATQTGNRPVYCTGLNRWVELATENEIPTKTSDLTNDSGFLTSHQDISGKADVADIPTKTSDLTNDSGFLTSHQDISGKADVADIPTKTSDLTNDSGFLTSHQDISGKADVADIPTKTSDLTNDSGFLTSHQDISGKADVADIPTKTSDLTNDSGFITSGDLAVGLELLFEVTYNSGTETFSVASVTNARTSDVYGIHSDLVNALNYCLLHDKLVNAVAEFNGVYLDLDMRSAENGSVSFTGVIPSNGVFNTITLTVGPSACSFALSQPGAYIASGSITADKLASGVIPTSTSDLTNDSDFITSYDLPTATSALTNDSGFITSSDLPTCTSDLTNDSDFITSSDLPTCTSDLTNDSGFVTSSDLPTCTSELTNDSGFITINDISGPNTFDVMFSLGQDQYNVYNVAVCTDLNTGEIYYFPYNLMMAIDDCLNDGKMINATVEMNATEFIKLTQLGEENGGLVLRGYAYIQNHFTMVNINVASSGFSCSFTTLI